MAAHSNHSTGSDPDHRLLAELAYIAAGYGMIGQVDAICGALEVLRPDTVMPLVIRATARINLGRLDEAERLLRDEALVREPGNAMAKAHLGLVLKLQGRTAESERLLRDLADSAADADAAAMARRLLARMATGPGG